MTIGAGQEPEAPGAIVFPYPAAEFPEDVEQDVISLWPGILTRVPEVHELSGPKTIGSGATTFEYLVDNYRPDVQATYEGLRIIQEQEAAGQGWDRTALELGLTILEELEPYANDFRNLIGDLQEGAGYLTYAMPALHVGLSGAGGLLKWGAEAGDWFGPEGAEPMEIALTGLGNRMQSPQGQRDIVGAAALAIATRRIAGQPGAKVFKVAKATAAGVVAAAAGLTHPTIRQYAEELVAKWYRPGDVLQDVQEWADNATEGGESWINDNMSVPDIDALREVVSVRVSALLSHETTIHPEQWLTREEFQVYNLISLIRGGITDAVSHGHTAPEGP